MARETTFDGCWLQSREHSWIEGISGFISYDTLAGAPETPTRKLGKL